MSISTEYTQIVLKQSVILQTYNHLDFEVRVSFFFSVINE